MRHEAMLRTVGQRVRLLREENRLSRRDFSEKCGVSERFLAQLEAGQGNISLGRLVDVCLGLGTTPSALLAGTTPAPGREFVALLGVRGAGKSTVGLALAQQRGVEFIELDALIEEAAGLTLAQIFEVHGEEYYRRVEGEVLARRLHEPSPAVMATGGSIVNHAGNYELLRSKAQTIWLKARPEDHWNRVIEQGDQRPMAENPHAFAELEALLKAREKQYALCDVMIDTSGMSVDDVTRAVRASIA